MKKLHLLTIISMILMFGCSGGSKIEGKVEDKMSGQPLSGIDVSAVTKIDIEEDKKYERKDAQTQSNGEFIIKGLSPKYEYTIVARKNGFSEDSTKVKPPEEGSTKVIESPLKIYELPPSKGVFVKTNGEFAKLNHISARHINFYSKSTKQAITVYYVAESLLDKTKSQKVSNGDYIFMNIGASSWYITPLNELSIEAGAEEHFEAPDENYNYTGSFPKGFYCGLSKLDEKTYQPESGTVDIGMVPYIKIDLPKGKYILTTSKFIHWNQQAYPASKYSPKSGWLFEVE